MTEIIPGLFLGCLAEAVHVSATEGRRWYVLNCSGEKIAHGRSAAEEILEFDPLAITDRITISCTTLDAALAFIDAKLREASVLVCCHSGRSRSAGLVVAYLARTGMSWEDAERKVITLRPEVEISEFIRRELQRFVTARQVLQRRLGYDPKLFGIIVVRGTGGTLEPFDNIAHQLEFRHCVQGRTSAETPHLSVATVKIRLHRARRKLQAELDEGCRFLHDEDGNLICEPKRQPTCISFYGYSSVGDFSDARARLAKFYNKDKSAGEARS